MSVRPLNMEAFTRLKRMVMADPINFDIAAIVEQHQCGTVACFAGHLVIDKLGSAKAAADLYRENNDENHESEDESSPGGWDVISKIAASELGLESRRDAEKIFYLPYWDEPFQQDYKIKRAKTANLLFKHFGNKYDRVSERPFFSAISAIPTMFAKATDEQLTPAQRIAKEQILQLKREMAQIACDRLDHFIETGD
ncbi:MAG: hypothetical protein WBB28_02145 [Crinalium sp.]